MTTGWIALIIFGVIAWTIAVFAFGRACGIADERDRIDTACSGITGKKKFNWRWWMI